MFKYFLITSTSVQNLGQSNYVFDSQHDARGCSIHKLDKCFADILQSIFQNKVIESTICENTINPESIYGSNCSVKEVNSQYLRLEVEGTHNCESVQGLPGKVFYSHLRRIPADCILLIDCIISNFQIS